MNSTVSYRILIKSKLDYYKLGTLEINRFEGDIYYTPSQLGIVSSSFGIVQKIIDHFSWHKSGRVHVKLDNQDHQIFEHGEGEHSGPNVPTKKRQVIKDVGFQEIIRDTVVDLKKIPTFSKAVKESDVVFDIGGYEGPVQFLMSIVSGRLIVKKAEGRQVPLRDLSGEAKLRVLSSQKRALGHESGNADKLLQYILVKYSGKDEMSSNRRVFVAGDSKIKRDT